jgi:preprotein translocase subunit SecF
MEKMHGNYVQIDWLGMRLKFFAISGVVIAACVGSILTKGFNYGIDFTGGTMVQVTYEQDKTLSSVRADLEKAGYPDAQPQSFAGGKSFSIIFKDSAQDAAQVEVFLQKFTGIDASNKFRVDKKEFVGPSVGAHLKRQASTAIVLALLAIIAYVAVRFSNPLWGAAGVIALAHDVIVTAGIFSILGREIDLVIVAAFLTIAGYSINDTIVIFDRMREKLRVNRGAPLATIFNDSVNEMQSRTLLTNGMVLAVVVALFALGGKVIHDFALAMVIGAVTGTYSTVAIAIPLAYHLGAERKRSDGAPARPQQAAGKRR